MRNYTPHLLQNSSKISDFLLPNLQFIYHETINVSLRRECAETRNLLQEWISGLEVGFGCMVVVETETGTAGSGILAEVFVQFRFLRPSPLSCVKCN